MQLTINISNEQLFEKILWLLNSFKNDGLEIVSNSKEKLQPLSTSSQDGLDFSSFKIESFRDVDGLEYQKKMRDEW
ncbi:MAG: hypothetical protein K0U38_10980 [Epsilonproteobacteria bacterium]|nr:hypothetical protein [Campylobacterota bacterium]